MQISHILNFKGSLNYNLFLFPCSKQATLLTESWLPCLSHSSTLHLPWQITGFKWNPSSRLQPGWSTMVLHSSISIFTTLHWAETERGLLFHVKIQGNRVHVPVSLLNQRCAFFKGYTAACLWLTPFFIPALRPGFLLFGWCLLKGVTWTGNYN